MEIDLDRANEDRANEDRSRPSSTSSSLPITQDNSATTANAMKGDTTVLRRSARTPAKRKTPEASSNSSPVKIKIINSSAPAKKKAKSRTKRWDPDFVLQDPKSPLTKTDLRAVLSHPKAWSVLSAEERAGVLAQFPDGEHVAQAGTAGARPDIGSLRNDDGFRDDAVRYCEDLGLGRHDADWLREAWRAHRDRRAGRFDAFAEARFEADWETALPAEMRVRRGAGAGGAEGGEAEGERRGERRGGGAVGGMEEPKDNRIVFAAAGRADGAASDEVIAAGVDTAASQGVAICPDDTADENPTDAATAETTEVVVPASIAADAASPPASSAGGKVDKEA